MVNKLSVIVYQMGASDKFSSYQPGDAVQCINTSAIDLPVEMRVLSFFSVQCINTIAIDLSIEMRVLSFFSFSSHDKCTRSSLVNMYFILVL